MMNFSAFGNHFSASIPNIHQFAAKFSQENLTSNISSNQDINNARYSSNGISSFTQNQTPSQQSTVNVSALKYQTNFINQDSSAYIQQGTSRSDKRESYAQDELTQEICAAVLQHEEKINQKIKHEFRRSDSAAQIHPTIIENQPSPTISSTWQSLASAGSTVADYLSHLPASTLPLSLHHFLKYSAENIKKENSNSQVIQHDSNINLLQTNVVNVNHLSNTMNNVILNSQVNNLTSNMNNSFNSSSTINVSPIQSVSLVKKRKKKKIEKEKKPRPKPGEIRLTTALDGSTLYCCPECHMAYPEKELLEQHLLGHTLERRFVCDICGAGLKRKDHLTRHKQSHNPERPYVCTVCLKAFKRKEQLTLHFVIHSGEKRHICTECGKGFYRKDHLRKHTRSHIARRVKAELSQQNGVSSIIQNSGMSS